MEQALRWGVHSSPNLSLRSVRDRSVRRLSLRDPYAPEHDCQSDVLLRAIQPPQVRRQLVDGSEQTELQLVDVPLKVGLPQ